MIEYSTKKFIEDLRRTLSNILPSHLVINGHKLRLYYKGTISDTKLSYLLCQYKDRIKRIKRNIREGNLEYKISQDELEEWEYNLNLIVGKKMPTLTSLFNKYQGINSDLPISRKDGKKVLQFQPDLKMDYFERIDTKKKAYWLGFLWADVYLGKNNEITIDLSNKDESQIDKFIRDLGLNPDYKVS